MIKDTNYTNKRSLLIVYSFLRRQLSALRLLIGVWCTVLFSGVLFGQYIHFSNPTYAPMFLNPALSGVNGDLQLITNYRTQWNNVSGTPFTTIAFTGSFRTNQDRKTNNYLAVGFNFYNDVAGVNRITTNLAELAVAYHLMVNEKSTLGIGIHTGIGQRILDGIKGTFGSQFDGWKYDEELPSGELLKNASFTYLDAGSGIVYTYNKKQTKSMASGNRKVCIGYAAFHLNRPNFSFIGGDDRLYVRHNFFVASSFGIANTKSFIEPAIFAKFQGPFNSLFIGADYRILLQESAKKTGFNSASALAFGLFYNSNNSFITRVMYSLSTFEIGFSYDFNVSTLQQLNNGRGGAEFFLRFFVDDLSNPSISRTKW